MATLSVPSSRSNSAGGLGLGGRPVGSHSRPAQHRPNHLMMSMAKRVVLAQHLRHRPPTQPLSRNPPPHPPQTLPAPPAASTPIANAEIKNSNSSISSNSQNTQNVKQQLRSLVLARRQPGSAALPAHRPLSRISAGLHTSLEDLGEDTVAAPRESIEALPNSATELPASNMSGVSPRHHGDESNTHQQSSEALQLRSTPDKKLPERTFRFDVTDHWSSTGNGGSSSSSSSTTMDQSDSSLAEIAVLGLLSLSSPPPVGVSKSSTIHSDASFESSSDSLNPLSVFRKPPVRRLQFDHEKNDSAVVRARLRSFIRDRKVSATDIDQRQLGRTQSSPARFAKQSLESHVAPSPPEDSPCKRAKHNTDNEVDCIDEVEPADEQSGQKHDSHHSAAMEE